MSKFSLFNGESIFKDFGDEASRNDNLVERISKNLRVAIPAKITSVNYTNMTCECQPLIRERLKMSNGEYSGVDLPLLLDVPIVFMGSANYSITFPLSVGDEGLVIFADMCIDSWWQSGDIQDQFEVRRHDLSDAFFIPAQMSQMKKYTSVDQSNLELKNRSSGTGIKITNTGVVITGTLSVSGDTSIEGQAVIHNTSLDSFITKYNEHTHSAPSGGGDTSVPNKQV